MIKIFLTLVLVSALAANFCGCSSDSQSNSLTVPYEPTRQMLNSGPEAGKQFLLWNATGLQIGSAAGYQVSGTCYAGQSAAIQIPHMLGMDVPPTALTHDSLRCTIQITDTTYTQTEYSPEGTTWSDSVAYWVDSTVVQWPANATGSDISFYWYNRDDGLFYELPTLYDQSRWTAKTVHFSRYILGQKRTAG